MNLDFSSINATLYSKLRTGYCPQLFNDIKRILNLDCCSSIMDVGAGTGQASHPFIEMGCNVVLVEPSDSMVKFLRNKYGNYSNVRIIKSSFEEVVVSNQFDMIIAGTSFHWPKIEEKYKKSYQLLKDDGHLVLFWSRPDFLENALWKAILDLKDNYCKRSLSFCTDDDNLIKTFCSQQREIRHSQLFICIANRIYKYKESFLYGDLCNWFDTFPDIISMDLKVKESFYLKLKSFFVQSLNLELTYYSDLYICNKGKSSY